mmetsp:Transcript_5999/g.14626  ORF Transcript_5999/g.14626 Transcript_5999/m.14626 type:complete len:82 (-) Transcript_5999:453-698(-)
MNLSMSSNFDLGSQISCIDSSTRSLRYRASDNAFVSAIAHALIRGARACATLHSSAVALWCDNAMIRFPSPARFVLPPRNI